VPLKVNMLTHDFGELGELSGIGLGYRLDGWGF